MDLVILDIDGTLLDTMGVDGEHFVRAFEEAFGLRGIDTRWENYEHCTDSWITRALLRGRYAREGRVRAGRNHASGSGVSRFSSAASATACSPRLARLQPAMHRSHT
jgi:beta-phosphoglucomutase-like phosphatase (HAD superfamily)